MEIKRFEDFKGGWYIGDFEPVAFMTKDFEVCYKIHSKGEKWETHYHKLSTEINYLIEGQMFIQGKKIKSGDIFIIYPYEIADPEFLTECKLIVVKTPSNSQDKYII
jgi:mannose-6-phosphate isomerase-like protein (cupin superfamily)